MEIIAEIGVNHNNQESILMELVKRVVDCDVDTVKLQRFRASDEISESAKTIDYQRKTTSYGSQLEMAQSLELSDELLLIASEYVINSGKKLLISPFDLGSAAFIRAKLGGAAVKIPSPEITNKSLIDYLAKNFDKLYMSTGASYLTEVARAIGWSVAALGREPEIELMHCVSQYPAPIESSNLGAVATMRREFGLPVGMSDHSDGLLIPIVCKLLGCSCLEKHVTLDKGMSGPDHAASANIAELDELVKKTRNQEVLDLDLSTSELTTTLAKKLSVDDDVISSLLGTGIKEPSFAESDTRDQIRKSFYINVSQVQIGQPVTLDIISAKRPWNPDGIDAADVDRILGKTFRSPLSYDDLITVGDLA